MSVPASWSVIFAVALGCWAYACLCTVLIDRVESEAKRTASYAAWRAAVTKKG